jgi:hypothetical protein
MTMSAQSRVPLRGAARDGGRGAAVTYVPVDVASSVILPPSITPEWNIKLFCTLTNGTAEEGEGCCGILNLT